jgi:hypothetical protein
MKQWVLIFIAIAIGIFGISPCLAQNGSGFSVAPSKLEITVSESGASRVYVYITSEFDGELVTGVEGVPFRVQPERISVSRDDRNRKIELTISSETDIKEGEYTGKLTFLANTGKNIVYGIKIDILIKKISGVGFVTELFDQITGKSTGGTGRNYTVIAVLVVAVLAALVIGIFVGRRFRRD